MKRLKYIRVILAVAVIILITFRIAGSSGWFSSYAGWLERIQLVPAVIAHAGIIVAGIIIFTLIFGRLYCSVICPLGIYMDFCLWLRNRLYKKRRDYSWIRPFNTARYCVLAASVITVSLGILALVTLLDPYEIYRWVTAPVLHVATGGGIYHTDIVLMGVGIVISSFWFLLITFVTLLWGRAWCNTACPVGALLGIFGKYSILRIRIDNSKCTSCGACEKKCKATCISSSMKYVDSSRCISCYNCLGTCPHDALRYRSQSGK